MIFAEAQTERAAAALVEMPGAAARAMARALNRAAVAGRQAAVEAITERYAVKASDVRAKIDLSTATPEHLEVAVRVKSPALALGYFPHTPARAGTGGRGKPPLRVEVLRGRQRAVRGAFIATINGKPRVMMRTGEGVGGRESIASVYSVPMAVMLGAPSVRADVERRALEVLDERLDHELDVEMARTA